MDSPLSPSSETPSPTGSHREDRFRSFIDAIEDYAIFMLDVNGLVVSWNTGARKIKGYTAEEIIGKSFTLFYPETDVLRNWPREELRLAAQHGRFEDEGWRIRKNGERFWANVVITALRDENGVLEGFAKITRDLTERRRNEELLRRSEERFRLLVDSVQDYAIVMLDPEGHIESWNAGAQSLNGYAAAEVLGKHFSLFYTAEGRAQERPRRELQEAALHGCARDEWWRVRKDGSVFWASVTVTAVRDAEGRLRGFAKVTRDMTGQRRTLELEASARRISEFLAILGHELRNPLAPIRNAVAVMEMDPAYPAALHPLRDILARQLTHVTRIVDDLLDIGRITSGKIVLRRERMDWKDLVHRSVEAVLPLMTEREHVLTVSMPPVPMLVSGDPTRLQQVLQNLLNNAAKYTPVSGRIDIETALEGDVLVTHIRDNGIGLSTEAGEKIFELFVQDKHENLAGGDGGLGIGLAMVRILLELHGGSVRVDSDGPGAGSIFTIRLPLSLGEDTQCVQETVGDQNATWCFPVLVVDDNRDSAVTMAALIQALGHPVEAVYDGTEAIPVALATHPRLILLDLHMPGKDGFDVLAELRALPLPQRPLIAAMTGYGQESDRLKTTQAGFDAHLTKPVEPVQLKQLLSQVERAHLRGMS